MVALIVASFACLAAGRPHLQTLHAQQLFDQSNLERSLVGHFLERDPKELDRLFSLVEVVENLGKEKHRSDVFRLCLPNRLEHFLRFLELLEVNHSLDIDRQEKHRIRIGGSPLGEDRISFCDFLVAIQKAVMKGERLIRKAGLLEIFDQAECLIPLGVRQGEFRLRELNGRPEIIISPVVGSLKIVGSLFKIPRL